MVIVVGNVVRDEQVSKKLARPKIRTWLSKFPEFYGLVCDPNSRAPGINER